MRNVAIRINGRVQGVGFRYHTKQIAHENNIKGFVKNMIDGSVYIEASGTDTDIEKFVNWCNKGPGWAYVESVDLTEMNDKGHVGFNIQ